MFKLNRRSKVTVSYATAVPEFCSKPTLKIRHVPSSGVGLRVGLVERLSNKRHQHNELSEVAAPAATVIMIGIIFRVMVSS